MSAVMTDGEEEDREGGPVPGYLMAQLNTFITTVSLKMFPITLQNLQILH